MGLEPDSSNQDVIDIQDKADDAFDQASSTTPAPVSAATPEPPSAVEATPDVPVTPEATPGPPPAEAQGTQPTGYSKDVNDLLLKHGGNLETAAKRFWEIQNQNAELARKVEELSQTRAEPPSQPVTEALDPKVQRFDSRLRAIEQERAALEASFGQKLTSQTELQTKIEEVLELMSSQDLEVDLAALSKDLKKLRGQKSRIDSEIERIKKTASEQNSEYRTIEAQRDLAQELRTLTQAREAEVKANEAAQVTQFRTAYDSTAAAVAEAKIPKDIREDFLEWAEAKTFRFLRTPTGRDEHGNPIFTNVVEDTNGFVSALADRYLDTLDKHHRSKSSEYSKLKAADATVNSGNGAAVTQETKKPRSVAEWDARDEELDLDHLAG